MAEFALKKFYKKDRYYEKGVNIMRRNYSIGFFAGVFLLSVLYCISDSYFQERKVQNQEPKVQEVTISGDKRVYAYYLMEEDGYVYVYLGDRLTLFERTSIRTETLPESLKEEIKKGKPVRDMEELFSFLENYSS